MTFKLVCIINAALAIGFGIAFVVAAEPTAARNSDHTMSPMG